MAERGRMDWLTVAALVAVLAVLLGAWLAFPLIQSWVARQDCVATGRTNCG